MKLFIPFLIILFAGCNAAKNPNDIYIRLSQVGFLPDDIKTAVIFSKEPLFEKEFSIKDVNNSTIFEDIIKDSNYSYSEFKHCYIADFTSIKESGVYRFEVDGKRSFNFRIGDRIFNNIVDSLMLFFKVQRCGPTNPFMHQPCHLSDATGVDGKPGIVDVTGGWHDAGDYIKFFSTAAYTSYMLLFAYEFDKTKFGFDNNKNNTPDILEEARVGIDWLLRTNIADGMLITQVQDLRDHDQSWRLPENDSLQFDRPGYTGIGKNQIGMFAAVMSLASRIWSEKFYDYDFAKRCLSAAERLYSFHNSAPDLDILQSGFYQDNKFWGKLALGAVELYLSTNIESYLTDAQLFADSAGSDYWWSWGNINSLAHYKLGKISPRYIEYIKNNLIAFNENKNKSLFGEGIAYTWGTTNSLLGVTLQSILYNDLTKGNEFDSLSVFQRDYVLGRNPWGVSFIYNIGKVFSKNFHSQIAYFNNGYLPGALSAGPAPVRILEENKIKVDEHKYDPFNTDSVKYYDDRNDFITNEPTITGNATAVFVYGYYSKR